MANVASRIVTACQHNTTSLPLYRPTVNDAAYQLRYSWTGWPTGGEFLQQPVQVIEQLKPLWEEDGLRVLEYRWTRESVQILFSATPAVAPVFLVRRAKGRLDHALRAAGITQSFSHKVAVRSVGENTRRDVEAYLERQVAKERFVDPEFARRMSQLTVINDAVDFSCPTRTARGRYWYNLHLVLIVDQHASIDSFEVLTRIRDTFLRIAANRCHAISRLAVLPDHLHATLRAPSDSAPIDLVYCYQNDLAYLERLGRVGSSGYYVGTFGDYSMQAIRKHAEVL